MEQVTLHKVETKQDLKRFIHVTKAIYKEDPNWIQPLTIERMDALNPKKNPYFDHSEVQLWIAVQNGKDVGRISAQIDSLAQEKWGPNLAHFGFFEASNKETAFALLKEAENWAKERGMTRIQGPWSLSANMEAGTLIDGYNTPPVAMMPHGRPDYKKWLAEKGYEKAKDLWAYKLDVLNGFPEQTHRIVKMAKKNKRLTLRELDLKHYDRDIETILSIFNDAWSDNWGYVPFTEAEGKHMAKELKPVIKPHRTIICEVDGEPAAFMVTIPDIYDAIKDLKGALFPFGIFKLLKRLVIDYPKRVRVPLMGVAQKFQRSPSGAAMAMWMINYSRDNVHSRGTEFGELSWILDDNEGMNKILIDIGCERYKTYRIFEKTLSTQNEA